MTLPRVCSERLTSSMFGLEACASAMTSIELGYEAMNERNGGSIGQEPVPEETIIFSLLDGYVLASWPGTEASVRLGRHEMVAAMMKDFLAQDELGKRLAQLR